MVQLALDKPQIQLKGEHPIHNGTGVSHLQMHPRTRLLSHIIRHDRHRQVIADGQGGAHIESTQIPVGLQVRFQLPGLSQQRFRPRPELPAQLIELQPLAGPLKELHVVKPFQLLQRPGCRRLGHAQVIGRMAHIFKVGNGEKDFQLPEGVAHEHLSMIK